MDPKALRQVPLPLLHDSITLLAIVIGTKEDRLALRISNTEAEFTWPLVRQYSQG